MTHRSRSALKGRVATVAATSVGLALVGSMAVAPSAFAKTTSHKATHHVTVSKKKAVKTVAKTKKGHSGTIMVGGPLAGGQGMGEGEGMGGGFGHHMHDGLVGTVSAVSSTSITLSGPNGNSQTFAVDPAVTVTENGVTSAIGNVAVNQRVALTLSTTVSNDVTAITVAPAALEGTVVSVGTNSFVISDEAGFYRTVNTSASTTYTNAGATATSSVVAVGATVMVQGEVDQTDHTSLDALSVNAGTSTQGMPVGSNPGMPMGGGFGDN